MLFFDAYSGRPEPYNNLIQSGRVIHTGEQGTTIVFTEGGKAQIAPVKIKIEGAINGFYQWPYNWYAYGFNHTPEGNGVYIYTPERGERVGVAEGISVIVENGKVTRKLPVMQISRQTAMLLNLLVRNSRWLIDFK